MRSRSSVLQPVRSRPRLAGYYAAMGVVVAVFVALWLYEGYYVVTAWVPSLFDDLSPINGVAAGTFMTLMLVCSLAALLRPTTAIGPARVLVVGAGLLGLLLPAAFVRTEALVTVVGVVLAGSLLSVVVWLHPARSDLLPSGPAAPAYPLLGLALLIAVPFVRLAAEYQWLQITLDDDVAGRWFYGGLAMYLLVVVAIAVASSFDRSTRRWTAGSAALLAGMLGLASVVYPSALHSLGLVGGGLVLVWAGCVTVLAVRA